MKSVHSSIRNVITYVKDNQDDLIAKLNGFLLVTLVVTLLVAWNVRSDNTVSSENNNNVVDELEQVVKNVTTEIETSNVLFSEMYCYTNHIAQSNDGDYTKVYPYFNYLKCLTMDYRYNSITSIKSSFYNSKTKKINISNLVYFDIKFLPYTYYYLFKLVKNSRNNHYFNFNKLGEVPRLGREITPFTFARARAPGLITLDIVNFKISYSPMRGLNLGLSNFYKYVYNYA